MNEKFPNFCLLGVIISDVMPTHSSMLGARGQQGRHTQTVEGEKFYRAQ
jgi:hypothetical protein